MLCAIIYEKIKKFMFCDKTHPQTQTEDGVILIEAAILQLHGKKTTNFSSDLTVISQKH